MNLGDDFKVPREPFETHEMSTTTVIVYSNLTINVKAVFESRALQTAPYVVVRKRRGRKKKVPEDDPNKNLKDGSVIQVKYRDEFYGADLQNPKKPKPANGKGYFRNSMSVIIFVDGKFINYKISRKGKFQITGCKHESQAEKCVLAFWNNVSNIPGMYTFTEGDRLRVLYEPVMYNIDFSLGFKINRAGFDSYINQKTRHVSVYEPLLGYAGVNIKFALEADYKDLLITSCEYDDAGAKTARTITYEELIKLPDVKNKEKYNTFLVFHSGMVIMSGKHPIFMKSAYDEFLDIIEKAYPKIREIIDISGEGEESDMAEENADTFEPFDSFASTENLHGILSS